MLGNYFYSFVISYQSYLYNITTQILSNHDSYIVTAVFNPYGIKSQNQQQQSQ